MKLSIIIKNSLKTTISFWFLAISITPFLVAVIFSIQSFKSNLEDEFEKLLLKNQQGVEIEINDIVENLNETSKKNSKEEYLVLATLNSDKESLKKVLSYLLNLAALDEMSVYDYDGHILLKVSNPSLEKIIKASLNYKRDDSATAFNLFSPRSAFAADDDFDFDIDVDESGAEEEDDLGFDIDIDEDESGATKAAVKSDKKPELLSALKEKIIAHEKLTVKSIDKDYGLRIDVYYTIIDVSFNRIIGIVKNTKFIGLDFCKKVKEKTGVDLMLISNDLMVSSLAQNAMLSIDYSDIFKNLHKGAKYISEKKIDKISHQILFNPIELEGIQTTAGMLLFLSKADFIKSVDRMKFSLFFVALVVLFFAIVLSTRLTRAIITPLHRVLGKLNEIQEEKDLTKRIDVSSVKELGELAKHFNDFIGYLEEIVTKVKISAHNFSDSSDDILETVEEVSQSTEKIAEGVDIQANMTYEASATMRSMNKSIQEVTDSSTNLYHISEESEKQASIGGKGINRVVENIGQISDNSSKIIKIISIIMEIASQTDLLALNAAIEAAKAGEQGKGFAVVADEVRKLAERSTESTKEISNIINTNTKTIEDGVVLVNETGASFDVILNSIKNTTEFIKSINGLTQNQLSASSEVVKAIEELSSVSDNNSSSVDGLLKSTNKISDAAKDLRIVADELNAIVEKFKVRGA
ncbi:methyl-accepting chemotaxis protein [Thermodesulfobacteriota bacterium]